MIPCVSRRPRTLAALFPLSCALLAGPVACSGSSSQAAPSHLAYPTLSATYVKGTPIMANRPAQDGGAIARYEVSPHLPPGLTLNPTTGVISGDPAQASPESTFTVTGLNWGGSASVALKISVLDSLPAPSSLATARGFHTGTLLADGRVLVTGGITDMGPSASAESFDAASGAFTAVAPMATPRFIHCATRLADGSVLVTGGTDGAVQLASAERFDPVTSTFASAGTMVSPRLYHAATLLQDGRVLLTGGYAAWGPASLASAELFDPRTGAFTATGSMHHARAGHAATLLRDGRVLVTGGFDEHHDRAATAELFDPRTGAFTELPDMDTARGCQSSTLLPDGRVLIAGGYGQDLPAVATAELFDPATGTFAPTGSLITARGAHGATLLPDGKVLISGGDNVVAAPDAGSAVYGSLELYDPHTGTFSSAGSFSIARTSDATLLLPCGRVLSVGGMDLNQVYGTAVIFDPATGGAQPSQSADHAPRPAFRRP